MVDKAIQVLGAAQSDPVTPHVKALLRKYFGDDGVSTYLHALEGFVAIKRGLADNVTYECENPGSFMYNYFCDGNLAYVRSSIVAINIHVCDSAFNEDDVGLARVLVHENSHKYDGTADNQYCWTGCTLDRWDAYNNADSYAQFARKAHDEL
jgi:hypothetical protein